MDVDETHGSKPGRCFIWEFFELKGFLCLEDFFPTGIGCGCAFNSWILIFVCVLLNQTIRYENNKTCISVILTMWYKWCIFRAPT